MAMLIAWQTVNAVRHPARRNFTRGFLVVTPGIPIRDRLRVRYTVGAADRDSDGLTVAASALTRNAGLIRDLANNAAALELGAHAVRNDPDFRLNGGARDTRRPKAVLVTPTGIPSGAGGVFIAGDVIVWEVRFDEPVRKTIARPDLQIQMPTSGSPVRRAPYLSGSDTALFRFRQVVQSADRYAGGRIRLGVSSANFTDRANNQPQIFGNEDQALAGFRVNGGAADARGPAVTGLTLAGEGRGPDGVFLAGDVIEATVAFDEAAAVTGTPQLEIGIGSAARRANYHSGSEREERSIIGIEFSHRIPSYWAINASSHGIRILYANSSSRTRASVTGESVRVSSRPECL